MSFNQPTPPLLLTKRLTTFLSANLNAHLHTALLATPSGRLLAHASPHPVALLRTQSTLAAGVVVIRRLKCGLLFVCIGPLAEHIEEGSGSGGQQLQQGGLAAHGGHNGTGESVLSVGGITTASLGSVGSVNTAGVVVMRRHAEELARWLDDKLGSLRVPEEGVGVE
uniref:Uncharacterized protein n=1 Tax=Colletotrichum fructicola (strain Nara gc5) TaxID=1213859 RepID=L2FH63_COLFN